MMVFPSSVTLRQIECAGVPVGWDRRIRSAAGDVLEKAFGNRFGFGGHVFNRYASRAPTSAPAFFEPWSMSPETLRRQLRP
jgi:hypothetical protein